MTYHGLCTLLVAALIASPASAQSVDCSTLGAFTHCEQGQVAPGQGPTPNYDALLNAGRDVGAAFRQGQNAQPVIAPSAAAQERRGQAYNQVGALIAAGKCEEAKRLAAFYNRPDIVADTAEACR